MQNSKISYRTYNPRISEKFIVEVGIGLKLKPYKVDPFTGEYICKIIIDCTNIKKISYITNLEEFIQKYESEDLNNWFEYLKLKYDTV